MDILWLQNSVFWVTLLILAAFAFRGYRKGLVKVAFSLVCIVVTLVVVTVVTPQVTGYLKTNTDWYATLLDQCRDINGKYR